MSIINEGGAKRLIADGLDILTVESNIAEHGDYNIVDYMDAVEQADVIIFLVAYKEFKTLEVKIDLDFMV